MSKRQIVAVVGRGEGASDADVALGFELGKLIAERGWILLSGGRAAGVMDGVNKGAKAGGGLTVGIIPRTGVAISEAVDIPIMTDMGDARNNIIVRTGDVVIPAASAAPVQPRRLRWRSKRGSPSCCWAEATRRKAISRQSVASWCMSRQHRPRRCKWQVCFSANPEMPMQTPFSTMCRNSIGLRVHSSASGLTHLRFANRAKSPSAEHKVRPCSIASAAT
jgi:hypothetical protein